MDTLMQDLRFALRTLRRSPGFALVAIVCLGLGIGVNTAVFSMVNTLLFRPLPMHEPDGVLRVYAAQGAQGIDDAPFSAADLADLRARSRTLADVAGYSEGGFNMAPAGGEPERVQGAYVSHNLFPLIGVRPMLGRGFLPAEDRPGGEPVVILGFDLWQRLFGGRRGVVGERVLISGTPRVVVGVMPPRFGFPETQDAWVPLQADPNEARSERWIVAVARLRPGTPLAAAERELAVHGQRFAAEHPATNAGWSFGAYRWRDTFAGAEMRAMMALLMAAVGLVLLIACANVANLLLARAAGRRREIAVRAAMGARRGRIVRQLLTESVVVALAGGALGTMIAVGWTRWLVSRIPEPLAYWMTFGVDGRVLAYSAALSAATGLVFGAVPALRASRPALQAELKEGTRGSEGPGRGRLRSLLVGGQIALAAVLLVAAGLMIRSVMAATRAELGFDTKPLLVMRTSLAGPRYDGVAARAAFFMQAAERLRALPGARDAAFASSLPGDEGGVGTTAVAEGKPRPAGQETATRSVAITPSFFRMLGVPLVAGRTFTEQEAADSASTAVVVSTELARELWPGAEAVGKRMRIGGQGDTWFTVVGVAPVLHYEEVGEDSPQSRRQIHVPYGRLPWRLMTLMVRADGAPAALAPAVRSALRSTDPNLPVWDVRTMEEYRRYTTWDRRLFGELFASFGALALLLAAVGVYGVTAYAVSQRTREIGIRVALGARGPDVVRLLARQGVRTVGVGVAIGIVGAWGASRAMSGVLYGVAPGDPLTFVLVPLLLAAVALAAHLLPARRASRVDPMVALRAE